ncbi:hypothetical protein [Natronorarus salvus]|uniref:hypothetical protein n=1 Tax=Natronorarus salvus TaxID=3117733 RepID=UPI002F267C53
MSLDQLFSRVPDPRTHSFPEYSLPAGEPVMPIAITREELSTLVDLYDAFSAVDPTGIDSNPFLAATSRFLNQTFGTTLERPDERLHDEVASLLGSFSDDLGGESIGVVDVTPNGLRTLYFFLITAKAYYTAPHIRFRPDHAEIDTLYRVYERVTEQDVYLKDPESVL